MNFVWPTSHVGMLDPVGQIGSRAKAQGEEFLRMADAAQNGFSYEDAKALFPAVSHSTVETRKSMYEELGLLYVPKSSDELHLTEIGAQLLQLLGSPPPENPTDELRNRVASLLCWAMTQTQINRPQSIGSPYLRPTLRAQCDIRPYAAFWQALFQLDGHVTFSEFSRVLAHVQTAQGFPTAVETILEARTSGTLPSAPEKSGNFGIYWKSHLSVAGTVLEVVDDVFRFVPGRREMLSSILQFQMGCEGNDVSAVIRAKPWGSVHEYYSMAGADCPAFIASGQVRVVSFNSQPLIILKGYDLKKTANGSYYVDGGLDLCSLKINMPCFHKAEVSRLLRVDKKSKMEGDKVRITLGLGRPINNARKLLQMWGE